MHRSPNTLALLPRSVIGSHVASATTMQDRAGFVEALADDAFSAAFVLLLDRIEVATLENERDRRVGHA